MLGKPCVAGEEKAMLMVLIVALLVMGVAIVVGCTRAAYS
jgi:hypothetical protein